MKFDLSFAAIYYKLSFNATTCYVYQNILICNQIRLIEPLIVLIFNHNATLSEFKE